MSPFELLKVVILLLFPQAFLGQCGVLSPQSTVAALNNGASSTSAAVSDVALPVTTDMPETQTHLIIKEDSFHRPPRTMPKAGFPHFIDGFLLRMDRFIALVGPRSTWTQGEYRFTDGPFELTIVSGIDVHPSFGDVYSAGVAIRDKIDHFGVRDRYYEIQVSVYRIGDGLAFPLAVIDVWSSQDAGTEPGANASGQGSSGLNGTSHGIDNFDVGNNTSGFLSQIMSQRGAPAKVVGSARR